MFCFVARYVHRVSVLTPSVSVCESGDFIRSKLKASWRLFAVDDCIVSPGGYRVCVLVIVAK